jgi:hypothetical protein
MIERDQIMRRLLFSILAMSVVSVAVGCHATHGVCDCGGDFEDNCGYRAPWVNEGAPKTDAPMPVPEIREALPSKKL